MALAIVIAAVILTLTSLAMAQGSGVVAPCGTQVSPCPQQRQSMDRDTTYKGLHVRIVTEHAADGKWRAQAELTDQAGPPVKTAQDSYASEQDAYTAALSAAMAQVDRARAGIGKP